MKLTAKECQVVNTIAELRSAPNKIIADKLNMSEHASRNHLTTIYTRLDVHGRMALYQFATSHRLVAVCS
jgi:DNA-binding CsgD family transcriptional regulator